MAGVENWTKGAVLEVQEYARMVGRACRSLVTPPFYYRDIVEQLNIIGIGSLTVVVLTGLLNTLMHITAPAQLWETAYGRTLIVKLLLVAGVFLVGTVNWRVVRPALRSQGALSRLRISAGTELLLAFLVLVVTAILTGQPRP